MGDKESPFFGDDLSRDRIRYANCG